jgi:hypothetical protein
MNIKHDQKMEAAANHKASLTASLKRRIESARSRNDAQLIGQLENEMKQLGLG